MTDRSRETFPHNATLLLFSPLILQNLLTEHLTDVAYVYCNRWFAQVDLLLDSDR